MFLSRSESLTDFMGKMTVAKEGIEFIKWLKDTRETLREQIESMPAEQTHRRGAAYALTVLIDEFDAAASALEKRV